VNNTDKSADIYIYDEICYWGTTASEFTKRVQDLDVESINLHVNSPGGSVFDGVAIYNTLVNHPARIVAIVDGLAASAASFIVQAGDEIVMNLGSTMMIHDASAMAWGDEAEMVKTGKILGKLSDTIAAIYANRAGGATEVWRATMREEAWYNAQEAVEAGLADRVEGVKESEEDPADRWDLSVFNFAGRGEAPSPDRILNKIHNKMKENAVARTTKNEAAEPEAPGAETQETEVPTAPSPAEPEAEPAPVEPENKVSALSVIINGVAVSDPKAIQAHISSLEQFRDEQRDAGRRNFVNKLAAESKITAAQVESLQVLAVSLSDEQYGQFQASWDAAPALPLLGKHGAQNGEGGASVSEAEDRIATLKGIVDHHRASGMREEDIKAMKSYQELQTLLAAQQS